MTDQLEIRRLFIEDSIWAKTSDSWKALKPLRDFNCTREDDETPDQYYTRLLLRFNIPLEVIEQWLYRLYYDIRSVENYGWLDYERVIFAQTTMSASQLAELNVLEQFRAWVNKRGASTPFQDFMCKPQDIAHWNEVGTWRVPPIVLDVSSLTDIPAYAEINGPYQLVEGHSRLGYLLAMLRSRLVAPESQHRVYLMGLRCA